MRTFARVNKIPTIFLLLLLAHLSLASPPLYDLSKLASENKDTASIETNELSPEVNNSSTLRQVFVVFRHGERTPADTYPNDPHINDTMAPYGWGQLTNVGKVNQYNQGLWLRKRYNQLLGNLYSPSIFHLQTTGIDRTQMSGLLEAAALWKPNDLQAWNNQLPWQPVPLRYQPKDEDTLLLVSVSCPAYFKELERVNKFPEIEAINVDNEQLYAELSNLTGLNIANPNDVQSLYSTLKAESDLNLTLPEWTEDYFPRKLVPLTEFSFVLNVYTPLLRRLKGGPFLKKIVTDMVSKVKGTESRTMFMYAGHDSTITNLLRTIGVWDMQMPNYNIMTMIELHEDKEGWNVQVFLRNTTMQEPYRLTVPGCTAVCPLEEFVTLLSHVIPVNWDDECLVDDPNYVPPTPLPP